MAQVKRVGNPDAFKILGERIKELDGYQAKAGWFQTARYENGVPVAYIASIHEFGVPSKNIPPRPFMRPTIIAQQKNWRDLMERGAQAILHGTENSHDVMEKIGLQAAGDVAATITQIWSPPLKPATIAARARKRKDKTVTKSLTKPLVDTGILLNTITSVVEEDNDTR